MSASIARRSLLVVTASALTALTVLVIALVLTGSTSAGQFTDPGAVVRWGTPVVKLFMNFSMAIAIGSLVFSAFAANPEQQRKLQPLASWSAAIWLLSAAIYFVMTYLSAAGITISALPGEPAKRPYEIAMKCWDKGFYVRYGGDTIQLAPPFISERAEIDRLVNALGDALNEVN